MWEKLWEINSQKYEKKGDQLYADGDLKDARLEYIKALEILSLHQINDENLEKKVEIINRELMAEHEKKAQEYIDSGNFSEGIAELDFILYLTGDEKKQKEIEKKCKDLYKKVSMQKSDELAGEHYKSGCSFLGTGDLGEAMVEFKEALKYGSLSVEFHDEIMEKLSEVEEKFARLYISKGDEFQNRGKTALAISEYERALAFLEYNKELRDKVMAKLENQDKTDDPSDEEWDAAYSNFRESLNKYLNFDFRPVSYWFPNALNPYEEGYRVAKKNLGLVYLKKARKHEEDGQFNLALKIYHEASSYFDPVEIENQEIRKKLKDLKSKVD
ncbi:MAG: hypothetical protein PHW04_15790 [Candidatus Wallbacteria bacterium]|nr:hypothetical protein [Candidatus Wallbacteria bacterium]